MSLIFQSTFTKDSYEQKVIGYGPLTKAAYLASKEPELEKPQYFKYKLSTVYWPGSSDEQVNDASKIKDTYISKDKLGFEEG